MYDNVYIEDISGVANEGLLIEYQLRLRMREEALGINNINGEEGEGWFRDKAWCPNTMRSEYDCHEGHIHIKLVGCTKEWCRVCGRIGGYIHKRRYLAGIDKVKEIFNEEGGLGYFVFTLPDVLWDKIKKKEASYLQSRVIKKMKERSRKGVAVWHWFGDCQRCRGKGCMNCNNTGAGNIYKPHLNILVSGKFYNIAEINEIKKWWRLLLRRRLGYRGDKINIRYSYVVDQRYKHRWRYICRPTHRIYNEQIAIEMKGYRNIRWWGKFNKKKVENKCKCPVCGKDAYFAGISSISDINPSEWMKIDDDTYVYVPSLINDKVRSNIKEYVYKTLIKNFENKKNDTS